MIVINPAGSDDTSSGLLGQKPGENRFGMLPRERGDVEPGTAGGLHYLLPQYSHQHRTDQTEDMEPRIAGADLSPLLGPFDNGREHLDRPASDLIVPNLRQLGKVARLPDHHLGDRADRHCASHCGEARQKDPENLIDREIGRHCGGPDGLDIRENRIGDHCPEQLLLVGEIEVERSYPARNECTRFDRVGKSARLACSDPGQKPLLEVDSEPAVCVTICATKRP
jgi:hypothetical protein